MENRVSLHYALKWFFTYSEKLIGSLFKNGQRKYMSKIQKRAIKFFQCFYVGPANGGTFTIVYDEIYASPHRLSTGPYLQ